MKGAAVRQLQAQMAEEGGPGAGFVGVSIGSAAGAEYRHNPQRWLAPYRLLLRKPEVWSPTLHIINTNRRSNSTSGGDGKLLTECPCTPQRKINVSAGTIDGRAADPPIGCSPEFAATGNPSCHLSTYQGGWRCCEHGVFLIDTAKECSTPDCSEEFQDEVYMKFTFYYADAGPEDRQIEGAACCDVTSDTQGAENIEYDIPQCALGTPPERCVHVAESVQPVGYFRTLPWKKPSRFGLVDLVFAAPHMHWAGISLELVDHETNKTICEVHNTPDGHGGLLYGNGTTAGNEANYLVGLRPCMWNASTAPRFRRDHLLRTRAIYNATERITGVMALWLMQVAAVR